ncbi:LRR domain containing protein [Trema orientale]|uniref:LRR domain containing protein n=1 Tax=Trema orientale TaxID=63057 RepID=A0A2P5ELK9_TREOI|nr:LRR domain containing protein [Trema orientale]
MMYEKQQVQMRKDMKNKISSSFNNNVRENKRKSIEEERLEIVDLSGLSLESLPNPTLNLGIICKLDLSNNNLQIIPESLIARLLNVVVLDVHSNQFRTLPNSIGCLSKLKVLNVSGNHIESLPKTIENCRSLEELNANFNQLSKLPDTIGFELTNLKKLSVNSNKLVFLPRSLSHLTSLRILDARLNCLRSLPEDLENLINLEILNVSQNFQYLETLPYSVGLLLSLVELDVSYNKITTLPDSIGCLRKLQKLCVEGNPLVSPPMDVFEQGLHAVKEYMSERMNNGGTHPRSSPKCKRTSWVGRLVKYGTFNGRSRSSSNTGHRATDGESFIMPEYRSIDGLASPRYMGMFSPRRLFSPRNYLTR